MEQIVWKDEYRMGVEEIDKQHMDFVKLINRFVIVFQNGTHTQVQDRILLELLKYIEYHCVSEENLMLISRYPDRVTQEEEHQALLKTMRYKYDRFKDGNRNGNDMVKYLTNWFLNHTQKEDMKFGKYIKDRGATSE